MAFHPLVRQSRKPYRRHSGAGGIARQYPQLSADLQRHQQQQPGLDYELAQQFADYLGVKLKITVRQNINELFDDLDNDDADMLAAGLVYNSERSKNYQPGPTYYSVSQQLVYRVGKPAARKRLARSRLRPAADDCRRPVRPICHTLRFARTKKEKYPDLELGQGCTEKLGTTELLERVADGKLDYTIADSVAISLFQRVHPELAVALDVTDEEPVTWFLHSVR